MGEILAGDEWMLANLLNRKIQPVDPGCEVCGRSAGSRRWWYSMRTRRFRCRDCFDPDKGLLRQAKLGRWNDYGATLEQVLRATSNDRVAFRQVVDRILRDRAWAEKYHQDPGAAVKVLEEALSISGLVRIVEGREQWRSYTVSVERLRNGSVHAIAREFFTEYDLARA